MGEAGIHVTNLLLTEVNEATWWLSLPRDRKPMKAGAVVKFMDGGRLARHVASMSRHRPRVRVMDKEKSVAAMLSLNVALNTPTWNVIKGGIGRLPAVWQPVANQLLGPDLELHAVVTDIGVGEPVLMLCAPEAEALRGSPFPALDVPVLGKVVTALQGLTVGRSEFVVLQATRPDLGDTAAPAADVFQEKPSSRARSPWLEAEIRLSSWASRLDANRSELLLQSIEQAYDQWQHRKFMSGLRTTMSDRMMSRMFNFKPKLDDRDFRSLVEEIRADPQWDAKARIGPRGNAVVAELEVGAELYRWFVARQILAGIRIRSPKARR